jgi:hypothetical protein
MEYNELTKIHWFKINNNFDLFEENLTIIDLSSVKLNDIIKLLNIGLE